MPRKQRSTFGSIAKLGSKTYRLRWWEEREGRYARRSENVRGTRREAERRLAEIRSGLDETAKHARRDPASMTIGEAYERWTLPDLVSRREAGTLATTTFNNKSSRWRLGVAPRWADVPIGDIRPLDVQEWLAPMTHKPAIDALTLLRQIIDKAVIYDVVETNVARRAYVIPSDHKDGSDGAYTLAQLDAIATAAHGSPAEAAIILMMFGGCRTGESLGVMLDEVTRSESHGVTVVRAEIVRQVQADQTISEEGSLKTPTSMRTAVVPPPWADRLWEVAELRRAEGLVWLSDDGTMMPLTQNRLRAEWRRAIASAGVPEKQPRASRRSWETYMRWDMGVDMSKVEQMMGHAMPGVTGAHYDKPTSDAFAETVAAAFARRPFVRPA